MGGRLHGLDALRGIAAICVLVGHVNYYFGADWFVPRYQLAVDFFFMLSGYVMARIYEARMRDGLGSVRFVALRFRRLFAASAVGATLAFAAYLAGPQEVDGTAIAAFVSALLFLPFPWHGVTYPFNGVRWSLTAELLANFVHGVILAKLSTKALAAVLIAMLLALAAFVLMAGDWPKPMPEEHLVAGIGRTFVAYIAGILLCRINARSLAVSPFALCLALPLTIFAGSVLPIAVHGLLFVLVVCPALIVAGASVRLTASQQAWASAAGQISYPLYAVHSPLLLISTAFLFAWQSLLLSLVLVVGSMMVLARRTLKALETPDHRLTAPV